MAKMLGRLLATLFVCFLTLFASAQERFTVPKVDFQPWQEVGSDPEIREYIANFPSAYNSGVVENDKVQLRVLLPEETDRNPPIVLILHYWGAPNLRIERALALDLTQRGIGAAILTLPYHLSRSPKGASSGQLAIQPDPAKLEATMTQAVMDVKRSLDFIEQRPECGRILGIYGTSLGAIVSSLSYANDARLKNAVFLLGGIDLAKIIWESSRVSPIRDELRKKGFTESSLRESLKPVEPAEYLPKSAPGRTLVIRATFDTVVPRACTDELVEKLANAQVLEIDTGHYGGVFIQGRLLRTAAQFFSAVDREEPFKIPKKIVAPMVRVGFLAVAPAGFDVIAGLDILKFDPHGRSYASILLTPRAPVVWIGTRVFEGLNFGFSVSNKNQGVGLLWSTVL